VLLRSRHPGQVAVQPGARPVPASLPALLTLAAPMSTALAPAPAVSVPLASPPGPAPTADRTSPPGTQPAADLRPGDVAPVDMAPAGDALEARLKAVWAETIGDADIGLDTDFFDLGGNSLSAVGLMGSIREAFGADLSIAALFDAPTIRSLAGMLREQGIR
jgi:phthiocerol/phenolphthiocerol synthesis type-I polyketide synthase E